MSILVINCGSSSLKYQLIDSASKAVLAKELCEKIGVEGSQITYQSAGGKKEVTTSPMPTHAQTIQMALDILTDDKTGVIKSLDEVEAMGHKIVHEGEAFTTSTLITEDAVKAIEECNDLAPLHNPANLIGTCACQELVPSTPMVDVFNTAFHQIIPGKACLYELPYKYYEKYKMRRYGSHGTSHSYVSKRAAEVFGCPYDFLKTMVCHLGNGSNVSAVLNGKSVDTSMGLTPLEGLVVGARGGDVDPGTLQLITHKENMDIDQMLDVLNKKLGVYGMSGVSNDFRDVENTASEGNRKTEAALGSLVYRVTKHVGAYIAAMSGMDAIAFTVSIDENDKITRKEVCGYLASLGVGINDEADSKRGQEVVISVPDSRVSVLVIPTNKELAVAGKTLALVK